MKNAIRRYTINRTKIEWADYTWNPVTGCKNKCSYCYARRIAENKYYAKAFPNKFKPTFYLGRLDDPDTKKESARIFVCSMADLFGDWVSRSWIDAVMMTVKNNPHHLFLFLTKNPKRYEEIFYFEENCMIGVTQTGAEKSWDIKIARGTKVFFSFEPLLSKPAKIYNKFSDWVIIGAQTISGKVDVRYTPKKEWIEYIVERCRKFNIPVFMKNNLKGIWPGKLRQEFPK